MLRPAPKPGTRQASAMEPVNRTRREETATSAAPARIARRVEEEEEEVVAMVWMCGKGVFARPNNHAFLALPLLLLLLFEPARDAKQATKEASPIVWGAWQ